jgi:putative aldouronate transport system substrate-binding protein
MKKLLAVLVVLTLLFSVVGCSSGDTSGDEKTKDEKEGGATSSSESTSSDVTAEEFSYPMESTEFSYWLELVANINQVVTNMDETEFVKGLEASTGVNATYQHPVANQTTEQFNLMVASGELTDIFEYNILKSYPGGPEKAISDGVIVDITDMLEEYAPNLYKFYEENPDLAKMARTDTGKYYSFPFIRGDESLMVYFGPVVNGAWLEDLGLEYPETMDEWYTMLKAFKEEKGATAPLTYEPWMISDSNGSAFIGAFGVAEDFYLDESGKVQYGSMTPEYKSFLETFSKWYGEGLLDVDIETVNREQVAAKLTTGESGATIGYMASRMGAWLAATEGDDNYDFVGVKYPVVNKGDIPKFTQKDIAINGSLGDAYITPSCENIEAAMRYLDYGYSEAGILEYNFGTEGVSYNMVDGYPTYTDLILNNPDMTVVEALAFYARSNYYGPFIQRAEYIEQYGYTYPQQKAANDLWKISDVDKYRMPNVTATPEESEELAIIMNEITTYRDEMQVKYIMGIEDLSSYDTYVENIESMGIERAKEIYEAAIERYRNR